MGLLVDIKKKMDGFSLCVSFEVGIETLALLGPSGCGKSMTLKCIAGIENPDEGMIILDGKVLFDSKKKINLPPRERKIGYLFQNYALFPNMTVEDNIGAGVRKTKDKEQVVKEKMRSFYLEGLEKKKPNQLSGGQQQRVALARIVASEPEIIMLDEPFSALDSYLRWQLEQEMLEVIESYQKPTIFVSHNRDEVYRISHRIGVMNDGKLEVLRGKKELFKNPETLSGALLTGCKNFSRILKLDSHRVKALDWQVELTTKEEVTAEDEYIGIRAHHIQVMEKNKQENKQENMLECRVVKVIENTFSMIIMLENVSLEINRERTYEKIGENSLLRMEIGKKEWKSMQGNRLLVKLGEEDLLLVK